MSSFANSELRKQLANKLGIILHITKRINQGGCKLDKNDKDLIQKPDWWNPQDVKDILMSLCIPGFENTRIDEVKRLVDDLKFLSSKTSVKTVDSSDVSGSQIIARLLKFQNGKKDKKK